MEDMEVETVGKSRVGGRNGRMQRQDGREDASFVAQEAHLLGVRPVLVEHNLESLAHGVVKDGAIVATRAGSSCSGKIGSLLWRGLRKGGDGEGRGEGGRRWEES
jgi:hypothetical protein